MSALTSEINYCETFWFRHELLWWWREKLPTNPVSSRAVSEVVDNNKIM